ncbi:hypothetical protein RhoFasK5_01020|nr:hypothetical protein [Rhodococcus kroppenstedtii]
MDHDPRRGRRELGQVDVLVAAVGDGAVTVAAESGLSDQRVMRIGRPRGLGAGVLRAHLRGQPSHGRVERDDVLRRPGVRRRRQTVTADLDGELPIPLRLLPPGADGIGITAVDHHVDHGLHPRRRPRPGSAESAGDVGVHQRRVALPFDQLGAGDDGADVMRGDHPVPQTFRHPRQPVAEGDGVGEQGAGRPLCDRHGGGDGGGAAGVRIELTPVLVLERFHEFGVHGGGELVLEPLQVAHPRRRVDQRVQRLRRRKVTGRRQTEGGVVERSPRQGARRTCPHLHTRHTVDPPVARMFECTATHRHGP